MTFWVAGAAVVGGAIAASGSRSAANTQAASADRATQAQRDIFERQVQLQEPWRQAGIAGLGRMNTLLGLTPAPAQTAVAPSTGSPVVGGLGGAAATPGAVDPVTQAYRDLLGRDPTPEALAYYQQGMARGIPLQAIQQEISTHPQFGLAPVAAAAAQATTPASADPAFGSLMRPFGMADFQVDPGYAFRQQQGEQGLQRRQSAGGTLFSGKALKDAMSFNQGLATDEYGKAYDRYRLNQGDQFNRLASITGIGQTATNTLSSAAGNFGQQVGSNIIGAGNAAAAGQVGSANAITGGIGQGLSMYQQNEMLKRFPYYGGTPYNPGTVPGAGSVGDFPIAYYG